MFSSRLPARLVANALTEAVTRARASAEPLFDLTETNPTAVRLDYPALTEGLATADVARYRPHPLGLADTRALVAAAYAARGLALPVDQIVLTASTSEAYSFLFKLLCGPGDEVLVPQPSYPLFDLLTRLDAVTPVAYRLDARGAWSLDRGSIERAVSPRTRAVLVVSPNNPTGSMVHAADREWLVELAARRNLALIADEVFFDYPLSPHREATSLAGESRALTFTLGGLSKSAGLPQMKLAWIAASGPEPLVREAMVRLEVVADTYLSVSTPVQLAAADLLRAGVTIRGAIAGRLHRNLGALRAVVAAHPWLTLIEPEGGWSAVVRVPAILSEEALVLRLLNEARVLVHPGYFFDFEEEAHLVLSLLPVPATFDEGVSRLVRVLSKEIR